MGLKYIKQFLIILVICFLGEGIKLLFPIPVPASIYGLVFLFGALQFKMIKVDDIKELSKFLIEIMPLMFIAPATGLMQIWPEFSSVFIPFIVIVLVSTIVVMGVSGLVTQWIQRWKIKKEEN